jgi:hypothetical protein
MKDTFLGLIIIMGRLIIVIFIKLIKRYEHLTLTTNQNIRLVLIPKFYFVITYDSWIKD